MDAKPLLELILLFVLHFQGISGRLHFLYKRSGQDAVLSCTPESSSPPRCSTVLWLYNKGGDQTITEVMNGEVRESSARAARLSVTTDCSLVINNVTAEDVGQYTCRQRRDTNTDVVTYLSVLTIFPSQPGADPNRDDDITLECSLFSVSDRPCQENRIRWVDETGAELLGEGDGYRVQQTTCVSFLTVKRQSGRNRKYTCQFVDKQNSVKIEADYTPDDPPSNQIPTIIGGVVGAVVVLVVIAVLIIYRKRANVTGDVPKPTQNPDEPESNLTYATVNHADQQASTCKTVKKEEVSVCVYSTVKCQKTEANEDPSNLYSNVRNLTCNVSQ